jgi:hypothetical protein
LTGFQFIGAASWFYSEEFKIEVLDAVESDFQGAIFLENLVS